MNEGLKKFEELVKTDTEFQQKLVAAAENFTGDKTDEQAIFNEVLTPVAEEYGISATYEELKEYLYQTNVSQDELSDNELVQISGGGGKAGGIGAIGCWAAGLGVGVGGGSGAGGVCLVIGLGDGEYGCMVKGTSKEY